MKPILFNTEMVRAILDERKTVTRRVVRPGHLRVLDGPYHKEHPETPDRVLLEKLCLPPYRPGDILYVRETWQHIPCIDCSAYETGQCNFKPVTYEDKYSINDGCFTYRADYPDTERVAWRPSIHMPREAARLFLRVTDVRVERLDEISGQGLIDEGLFTLEELRHGMMRDKFDKFEKLWNSIIRESDLDCYGRVANPWVWVIVFERCEKPEED